MATIPGRPKQVCQRGQGGCPSGTRGVGHFSHHPPFRRVPRDQRGLSSTQRMGIGAPLPQKRWHG
eukprot:5688801-Pyramimonas_sp.AAC.1